MPGPEAHTGRELARLIGQSHNTTRFALETRVQWLDHQATGGQVQSVFPGSRQYRLLGYPVAGVKLEERLFGEVASILSQELGKVLLDIILFGSVAKGEEAPRSDLDLVLVLKDGVKPVDVEDRVSEASLRITKRFGNQVSPILVNRASFERKSKARQGLWREIAETGISIINDRGTTYPG